MRSKRTIIGLSAVILIGTLVWLDISAHARKNGLIKVLSEKGNVILSPQVTEALLRDLNSGDTSRLEQWRNYLYMSSRSETNLNLESTTIRDLFARYTSKEKPGRSNYFNLLVSGLRQKQRESSLSGNLLREYLGTPDFISDGPNGQTSQYEYQSYGRRYLASAVVSNNVVVSIDIYAK